MKYSTIYRSPIQFPSSSTLKPLRHLHTGLLRSITHMCGQPLVPHSNFPE